MLSFLRLELQSSLAPPIQILHPGLQRNAANANSEPNPLDHTKMIEKHTCPPSPAPDTPMHEPYGSETPKGGHTHPGKRNRVMSQALVRLNVSIDPDILRNLKYTAKTFDNA